MLLTTPSEIFIRRKGKVERSPVGKKIPLLLVKWESRVSTAPGKQQESGWYRSQHPQGWGGKPRYHQCWYHLYDLSIANSKLPPNQQLGNIYFLQSLEAGKAAMTWFKLSHKAELRYWQDLLSVQGWTGQICFQVHFNSCWHASSLPGFLARDILLATWASSWDSLKQGICLPQSEKVKTLR